MSGVLHLGKEGVENYLNNNQFAYRTEGSSKRAS